MTKHNKRITPMVAAKEIFLAFGEQTDCMDWKEMFEGACIDNPSPREIEHTMNLLQKVQSRVRKYLRAKSSNAQAEP